MALYCNNAVIQALMGIRFPAAKGDLIAFAEAKDALEAVVVVLNALDEGTYRDMSEVCENIRTACNREVVHALSDASFPAVRAELIGHARAKNASASVIQALESLPSQYHFESLDSMCDYIL